MAKLSEIKIDKTKAEEGVWFKHHMGFEFLVARLGNQKYKDFLAKLARKKGRRLMRGTPDIALAEDLVRQAVARHIVLDWKNIEDEEGALIPHSPEKCLEIISNPEYDILYREILEFAQDEDEFCEKIMEESAGNSANT